MRPIRSRQGFTLIEFLVVVAVILTLSALLFPVFSRSREQARFSGDLSALRQIGIAAEIYSTTYEQPAYRLIDLVPGFGVSKEILSSKTDPTPEGYIQLVYQVYEERGAITPNPTVGLPRMSYLGIKDVAPGLSSGDFLRLQERSPDFGWLLHWTQKRGAGDHMPRLHYGVRYLLLRPDTSVVHKAARRSRQLESELTGLFTGDFDRLFPVE